MAGNIRSPDADIPLLFVLREEIGLTGTKYGGGEGQCGACTVLIGGPPRRSCQLPTGEATQPHQDNRRSLKRRQVASPTAGISGPRGVSVCLFHVGNDHERTCACGAELEPVGFGDFSTWRVPRRWIRSILGSRIFWMIDCAMCFRPPRTRSAGLEEGSSEGFRWTDARAYGLPRSAPRESLCGRTGKPQFLNPEARHSR